MGSSDQQYKSERQLDTQVFQAIDIAMSGTPGSYMLGMLLSTLEAQLTVF